MSTGKAWGNASKEISRIISTTLNGLEKEVVSRTYRASNELRNSSLYVLRGKRSGRRYKVPGTFRQQRDKATGKRRNGRYYTASAPGEAPALRTGGFRLSWGTHARLEKSGKKYRAVSSIESNVKAGKYLLGDLLEDGTKRMKARPYKQAVRDRAMPRVRELYNKPYKL